MRVPDATFHVAVRVMKESSRPEGEGHEDTVTKLETATSVSILRAMVGVVLGVA